MCFRFLILLGGAVTANAAPPVQLRMATFNASLNRTSAGQLYTDLSSPSAATPGVAQAKRIAEIIQRTNPDILLVNEFDYDATTDIQGRAVIDLFHDNFLAVPQQSGLPALNYPFRFTAPSNTGIHSGLDLDNSGGITTVPGTDAYGNDCFGFGQFSGQYGMAIYSKFPIQSAGVRTFQKFLWRDLPGALLPDNPATLQPKDWYSTAELAVVRLSSKSHWDVPIDLGGGHTVHFLVDHPTPPVFDGAEDRNGKRNHDEIRFWADYIAPSRATYHRADNGTPGGLPANSRFFIAGDHNADPSRGDSVNGAAQQFTTHPLINNTFVPSAASFGNNTTNTADFSPTDLRVDYALPSVAGFTITDGGVFWPVSPHPLASLVTTGNASDHKLVWLDLKPTPILETAVRNLRATLSGGSVLITFTASAGYAYQLEETASLAAGPWTAVAGNSIAIDPAGNASTSVAAGAPGRRFFRIRVSFAP